MALRALITGISGRDGSYLAELLLPKGYEVHRIVLCSELEDTERSLWRLATITDRVNLHPGASRDWGFAGDYVHAMWLMLQQDKIKSYYHNNQTHPNSL